MTWMMMLTTFIPIITPENVRKRFFYTFLHFKQCKGYGECLYQINSGYRKNPDYQCLFNCYPKRCKQYNFKEIGPQWYFDCRDGLCVNCDMGVEPLRIIMLDVPFSEKNNAKRLGAKFESYPYKKWCIKSNHRNKDEILSKFKEWKCSY